MHSMKAFFDHHPQTTIVLVLHPNQLLYWPKLCKEYDFSIPHKVVAGGETRFHSVLNGLQSIWNDKGAPVTDDPIIAIHDGVRPLVTAKMIEETYQTALKHGSAIPAVKSTDSVRLLNREGTSSAVDRNRVMLIQTPQTFRSSVLKKAYGEGFDPGFTDDASVVEKSGHPIHIVEGDTRNIKVTYPADLVIADKLIESD